jgi:ketosteroid isomerase-like protein
MSDAERSPRATVRAYLDALNRGDADDIAACVSENFINEHTSTLGETIVGREAYRNRVSQFLQTFAQLHYDTETMIVDGEEVAVPYRMSAIWRDRPFTIRGMFRFRVEQGHVVHRVDYWDSADFTRQVEDQPNR